MTSHNDCLHPPTLCWSIPPREPTDTMKITSFSAATLAAALLVGTANAGFPDEGGSAGRNLQGNGKNKDKNKKDTNPGPPISDDEGEVDLIIKYKNEKGANNAKGIAKDGKLKEISSKKKLAATTAPSSAWPAAAN